MKGSIIYLLTSLSVVVGNQDQLSDLPDFRIDAGSSNIIKVAVQDTCEYMPLLVI